MNVLKLVKKLGLEKIKEIVITAHDDAVYYVDEWTDSFGGIHGYCTDKFFVGHNNPHTHYRLSNLKEFIEQHEQTSWHVHRVNNAVNGWRNNMSDQKKECGCVSSDLLLALIQSNQQLTKTMEAQNNLMGQIVEQNNSLMDRLETELDDDGEPKSAYLDG